MTGGLIFLKESLSFQKEITNTGGQALYMGK